MFEFETIGTKYGIDTSVENVYTYSTLYQITTDASHAFVLVTDYQLEETDNTFSAHNFTRAETIEQPGWAYCLYVKEEHVKPKYNLFGGFPHHTWQYRNGWWCESRPLDYSHGWYATGTLQCNTDFFPFHFDWTHKNVSKSVFMMMRKWNGIEWRDITDDDVISYLEHPVSVGAKYRVLWIEESRGVRQDEFDMGVRLLDRFDYVLTHDPKLIHLDNALPCPWVGSCLVDDTTKINPVKDKMVSLIFSLTPVQNDNLESNGYQMRKDIVERYKDTGKIDMYGKFVKHVDKKEDALLDYRFSLAVENFVGEEGETGEYYFTEKILDCFHTRTIPIYYGNSGWSKWFDPNGVLTFETVDELDEILENLSEELYESMRDAIEFNYKMVTTKFASMNSFLISEYPFLFD